MNYVGSLNQCREEFDALLERKIPDKLSDEELVEKALAYEKVLCKAHGVQY